MTSLAHAVRTMLLPTSEVGRLSSLRRSSILFSQDQTADALYFMEDGLVKLTRTNALGERIVLLICGPGELVGEEVLSTGPSTYQADAEVITTATLLRVPKESVARLMSENPNFAIVLVDFLLQRRLALSRKVELLCLHDVEYRILFYLSELASLVPADGKEAYHLPITQAELADLIGATRETTSTTLNQLERRGLVKLSRRLLTVPSPSMLKTASIRHAAVEAVTARTA